MIWISHVSLQLTFAAQKPVTSKDFKVFDDLDISCQFAIDICSSKTRNVLVKSVSNRHRSLFSLVSWVPGGTPVPGSIKMNCSELSKDFKVFDELDISCQFAIDICS